MVNKPYLTRKNLLSLAMSVVYAFILLFTGLCLESSNNFVNNNNPIAHVGKVLNFKEISCGISGYVCLILVAVYIVLGVASIIYARRYAIVNNKKATSLRMILVYCGIVLLCLLLSLGIGIVVQSPLTKENISNTLIFVYQSVILALLIYLGIVIFVGTILMLVVNFIYIDKPYRFFTTEPIDILEDDEEDSLDIKASFDAKVGSSYGSNVPYAIGQDTIPSGIQEISASTKVEKLDDREKVFPSLSGIDVQYDGYAIEKVKSDDITLEELCNRFRLYLASVEKLYFDVETIRIFISGFASSHFLILEGLSGTGKSSLPRYFAKFIQADVLFIPVQATWRDKSNLLGYFNDFSKTYQETDFLIQLYKANYNPDKVQIFVLDEMNISRVEYYFADFLSVLEYPTDEWKLRIMQLPHEFIPPAKLEDGYINIPENTYFVGTANKDDSTFSITDKVYDRAITIEFDSRNEPFAHDEVVDPICISASYLKQLFDDAKGNPDNQMDQNDYKKFSTICDYIYEEFDITFGNRILNQIAQLVPVFVACGGKKEEALDFILSRKILVKLEGRFEEYILTGLKQLLTLLAKTYGSGNFKKSEKVIKNLIRKL